MKALKHSSLLFIFSIAILSTLISCRSKQEIVTPTNPTELDKADPVTRVNNNRMPMHAITSKVSLTAGRGTSRISVSGTLKMQRDKIIQLSLTPYGLIEVGRLELTPDYFMLMDRWNKQYVQARWSDVKTLSDAGVDFYVFQALFWEELFVPGRQSLALPADFTVSNQGETFSLKPTDKARKSKDIDVAFVARALNGLIQQTSVETTGSDVIRFLWDYTKWSELEGRDFPEQMVVNIHHKTTTYAATFNLSHLRSDNADKDLRTKIDTKRYREVELSSLMDQLMKM